MNSIKLVLMAAIFAITCAEGMRVDARDLGTVFRRPSKLLRGLVAVQILVPLMAVGTVLLVRPSFPVTGGLACLAAAPLAPLVLQRIGKTGADRRLASSLHLSLAALSIFTAPLVIAVLGRVFGFPGSVGPLSVAKSVLVSLFLPFGVGLGLHALAPRQMARVSGPVGGLGLAVVVVVAAFLLMRGRGHLVALGLRDYAAMALFCGLALASGHFMAASDGERTTFALESAARNPALALLIATSSVGPVRAAPVLVPYLVIFFVTSSLYVTAGKRLGHHPSMRPSAA
jgi:predicted Na+-dependent transporter